MKEAMWIENEELKHAFFRAIEKKEIKILDSKNVDESFLWDDVIACKNSELLSEQETYTCKCGNKMFWMYSKSPPYTWQKLIGQSRYLLICPHCVKQVYFICNIMN